MPCSVGLSRLLEITVSVAECHLQIRVGLLENAGTGGRL